MTDAPGADQPLERPRCPNCGDSFSSGDLARHSDPVECTSCYRCTGKPACYTCGNMYCPCKVHQYG